MKANELRIGNCVGLNLKEHPLNHFRMVEISEHSCVATSGLKWHPLRDREFYEAEDLDGIPLSPEWLERFGFKRSQIYEQVDGWFLNPLSIQTNQEIFMVTRIGIDDLELKYIHQLQNLYFALTGNELSLGPNQ